VISPRAPNDVDGLAYERGKGSGATEDEERGEVGVGLQHFLEAVTHSVGIEGEYGCDNR
jgi:hypothetical protein